MPLLPFFPISERVVINIKQVKMFVQRDDGSWDIFFDRADEAPLNISAEQYEELFEAMMEKKMEKEMDRVEKRSERMERDMSRDARRFEMAERALRRMGV